MTATFASRRPLGRTLAASLFALAPIALPAAAAEESEIDTLKAQLETLVKQNQGLTRSVEELRQQVGEARDEARAARDAASEPPPVSAAPPGTGYGGVGGGEPLAQTSFGGTRLQLMDMSLDVLTGFGFSTAKDDELELLQGGDHDPRRRGFNLQQAELSLSGAVDPYFTANANIVYAITPEGETNIELEEAYALDAAASLRPRAARLPAEGGPVLHGVRAPEPEASRTSGSGRTSPRS